jgi:hypothetical protein
MTAYADTSFLFSLYVPDAPAATASAIIRRTTFPIFRPSWANSSSPTPFAAESLRRTSTLKMFKGFSICFPKDIVAGIVHLLPVSHAVFARGKQAARSHTSRLEARGLDVLHVASALVLGADVFYTFDRRQGLLATAVGLNTR